MNNVHIGDSVTQFGNNNVGIIKTRESQAVIAELVRTVSALRDDVDDQEKEGLDESLADIKDPSTNARIVRRALDTITRIATGAKAASAFAAPVLGAIEQLRTLFSS